MTEPPTEPPAPPEPRALPRQREGAPRPGEKRKRHTRWKRVATAVMILLLIGFAILTVNFLKGANEDEGIRATQALLEDLGGAIEAHHARVGELPTKIAELSHPSSPYRGSIVPEDAYGSLIVYEVVDSKAGTYRLRSPGADRKPGTDDDIVYP